MAHDARQERPGPPLEELLMRHEGALRRFLARAASGLLRYEAVEDLVQGVHLQALQVEKHLEYRDEDAFRNWLFTLARQHVARRHAWWRALKRDAGRMIRLGSRAGQDSEWSVVEPALSATGPVTLAERRDQLRLAVRALSTLVPRDREIVHGMTEGLGIREMADRLGISYDAAQRARLRALERFRQAFTLLAGSDGTA